MAPFVPACCSITPDFSADSRLPVHSLRLSHLEGQFFTSRVHIECVALLDVPSQEFLSQRMIWREIGRSMAFN